MNKMQVKNYLKDTLFFSVLIQMDMSAVVYCCIQSGVPMTCTGLGEKLPSVSWQKVSNILQIKIKIAWILEETDFNIFINVAKSSNAGQC